MKNTLRVVLCLLIIPLLLISVASANDMNISWNGNYGERVTELDITFKSKAPYTQQVTAAMYGTDVTETVFYDYVRMAEVQLLNGNETTL